MFWNSEHLCDWASTGGLTPFDPKYVNPASVDLHWNGKYKIAVPSMYVALDFVPGHWDEKQTDTLTLYPEKIYLLSVEENIVIPNNSVGWFMSKFNTELGCVYTKFLNPGFSGKIIFEVENRMLWPVSIENGQCIGEITLADCEVSVS